MVVARRMNDEELIQAMTEDAEAQVDDRLAEPRRYSVFYDLFAAEGKAALREIAVEIGELKAIRETFRNDPKIVEWCKYFTTLALRKQEEIANGIQQDKAKAKEYRGIEDLFRRRQGDFIRGNGSDAQGSAESPGQCEVAAAGPGSSNGRIPGRGADCHIWPDEERENAPGADDRGELGETAGVPPVFKF